MTAELPFLTEAIEPNQKLMEFAFGYYPSKYLKLLDNLFEELVSGHCEGIAAKVKETSPEPLRFQSFVSELEFARYFLSEKMQVTFLSCNAFHGRKVPDIYAKSASQEYFVEVKNIQEDDFEYVLGKKIVEILNLKNLSFMVVVVSLTPLSEPAFFCGEKEKKGNYVKQAIDDFLSKLQSVHLDCSSVTIRTSYADIELVKTTQNKSYLGIKTSAEPIFEPSDYALRIRKDVIGKAKKRENWVGDELDKLYIVAIDDDYCFFYPDRYNMELFGISNTNYGTSKTSKNRLDEEIETAARNGWEEYLKQMFVLKKGGTVIPDDKRGMFFLETVARNITAIIAKHRESFYLFANPMAEQRINSPQILQELKGSIVGWE